MAQSEHKMLESSSKFNNYHQFTKKTLPVSLLSFLLSYTSGFSFFSYNFHSSIFSFSLFTHTLEKKYMFLICNGILAFLAKISSSPPTFSDPIDEFAKGNEEAALEDNKATMKSSIGSRVNFAFAEENQQEEEKGYLNTEAEEKESGVLIAEKEETEGEEGNEVNLNTDELNKKFDEFIRKMKEEIRIEAQRHTN